MTPEFSRPVQVERVGAEGRKELIKATPGELAALAVRFDLPAIDELGCRFDLNPLGAGRVMARGLLTARVRQTCVATLEEFPATVVESFVVHFVPEDQVSSGLDLEAPDEVPYSRGALDLGEAAAEQLGLALDPFPRKEDADLPVPGEDGSAGPFSALADLRRPPS